jgi:ribosomal protein S18 acetylase RimI-like enzyme
MLIREASLADAERLASLFMAFNYPYSEEVISAEQMRGRLQACAGVEWTFVVEFEGLVVGFVCVRVVPFMSGDGPYAEVSDLFVAEGFRRRGFARALLLEAGRFARERGAEELVVLTGHENVEALGLYRSVGFGDYAVALRWRLG